MTTENEQKRLDLLNIAKDDELKRNLKEEFIEKWAKKDEINRKVKTAAKIKKEKKAQEAWFGGGKDSAERGVIGHARDLREASLRGYNEWNISFMETLKPLLALAKAQDLAPLNPFGFMPGCSEIDAIFKMGIMTIKKKIVEFTTRDKELPTIAYQLKLDKDGQLNTQVTKDGVPLNAAQKAIFDKGVELWLTDVCGYSKKLKPVNPSADPDKDVYLSKSGEVLTDEDFQMKLADPSLDITSFFKGRFSYENIEQPSSTMRP